MTIHYGRPFLTVFGMFLLISQAAHAATWSTVASACVPDNSSAGKYAFSDGALTFAGSHTGSIAARCNVTNPFDDTADRPIWNLLTVGYRDPDGNAQYNHSTVTAKLFRVRKDNPVEEFVAKFDSQTHGTNAQNTSVGVFFSHGFDFRNYAYYVLVSVERDLAAVNMGLNPKVWYVKLSTQ